ncbi:hypothetical protein NW762_012300 [Fusarium torreyae]|uniref:Uncharacterized protein n=1 Tax=Fusarium torreyae TaxID=1237075 RepID=A0A9W8RS05_9HYPO|nr:hypothetical protein NW762_012300 [Fusarium torreyae]
MCKQVYRKYDCTKCQRRIRDQEWITHCDLAKAGKGDKCETDVDFATVYVPADECQTCEMHKAMEEHVAAEKEKEKKSKSKCEGS